MFRGLRFSRNWARASKNLVKLAAFAILLLLPLGSHGAQTPTPSMTLAPTPATPVLRVGDTWHYHYSGTEQDSTEQILRDDNCGTGQCVVDQETNPAWNDTVWLNRDWNLSREYYVDRMTQFNSSSFYSPAFQLYPFPLHPGESWWLNSTVTGWYKDQSGNHTQAGTFSNLREVVNQTVVTVPAGTFETFLVVEYTRNGTLLHEYRWFSTDAKTSVKLEIFDQTGAVSDSYMMTSYSLALVPGPSPAPNPSPSPSPSPSPTSSSPTFLSLTPALLYSIVGALVAAMVTTVVAVALLRRKKPMGEDPWNPPAEIT